jgi:hypothetical protein
MKRRSGPRFTSRLRALDFEVHNNWFLTTTHDYRFALFIAPRVDLLMWHVRRHINEIAGSSFVAEFEVVAPSQPGLSAHYIEHRFEFSMMMRPRFGAGLNDDSSRPQLGGSATRMRDCRCPRHTGSLRCVRIQLPCADDLDSLVLPVHRNYRMGN